MKKINVGIIGAGFMCKAHSLAYAALPMFFWPSPAMPYRKTLVDQSVDTASAAAKRYGFENYTTNWMEVIHDPSIDVVDIVTPNNTHAEIAIAAAKAGKHIITEKPMARNLQEAKTMLDAVRKAGVKHMVAFNYRKTPAVVLAKKYLEEGTMGKVLNFRGTYLQDWSADPATPLSWRFQHELAGSGAMGDIASHVLDLARYLVGEVDQVLGITRTWINERPVQQISTDKLGAVKGTGPKKPVDVDDEVCALLEFENGAIGSIEATRNAWGRNNFLSFEIHCEKGSLAFNYERRDELQVCFSSDPDDRRGWKTVMTGPAHPYGDAMWPLAGIGIGYGETKIIELYEFMNAIADDTAVSPSFEDGYRVELIADAINCSAAERRWVQVGENMTD